MVIDCRSVINRVSVHYTRYTSKVKPHLFIHLFINLMIMLIAPNMREKQWFCWYVDIFMYNIMKRNCLTVIMLNILWYTIEETR